MTLTPQTYELKQACLEIIQKIKSGEIKNRHQLEYEKTRMGKKYHMTKIIKNADIVPFLDAHDPTYANIRTLLKTKPVRTVSGVANIAVMWKSDVSIGDGKFFSCPAECVYCPQGKNAPKSYTGVEPTTLRAKRHDFDPYKQIQSRLFQLELIGHHPEKCELIIMGGTFTAMPKSFQDTFVKNCFEAFNKEPAATVQQAQKRNETTTHRCVGLTIETRADFCDEKTIEHMLELGCTRVEIGVQSTSDEILKKIKRGHDTSENKKAIARLRNAGLKITAHWMPGLTGLLGPVDMKKEVELFKTLFDDPAYRPDEIKIYPTLVMPNTQLYELWKTGTYHPLTTQEMITLLVELKKIVPPYIRIKRIMRDISEHEVMAGPSVTNLRQLTKEFMKKNNVVCPCIRCREVGLKTTTREHVTPQKQVYEASSGTEYFLSYENIENNSILGFLRLRLDTSTIAKVRELHVYGPQARIGKSGDVQHQGLGKKLVQWAEDIAKQQGKKYMQITAGVGVREYYIKELDYKKQGFYVIKTLS